MNMIRLRARILGAALLLMQAILSHGLETKQAPLFQHESDTTSLGTDGSTSESRITYLDSSGVIFLEDSTVLEYVLSSQGFPLLDRSEQHDSKPYNLRLSLFNLNHREATATKDIAMAGKSFKLFRTRSGNVLVVTQSRIFVVSPDLNVLRQTPLSGPLRDTQTWTTDISGEQLYLIADSTGQCPTPVQVLDSESLASTGSWCFGENRDRDFFGVTTAEYSKGRSRTLSIYRAGKEASEIDLPRMLFVEQVLLLSTEHLVAHDGANLLSYRIGKGVEFYTPILRHWNVVSPMSCNFLKTGCTFVMARPKSDVFDVRRKTTFKDVAVVVVSLASGKVQFQHSVQGQYKEVSDIKTTLSPTGNRVAIWLGSSWEVYPVPE